MDNTRLTKEGLWRAVLGDATGAPAKPAAAAAAAAATKGKGKEKETEKPVKEAESCFLFKRKFLKYVGFASA
jgi:ribosomal protein L12E/L44/L45/RPP1/RPP2